MHKKNWAEAYFHRERFLKWWKVNAHTLNFPMVYLGDEPNTYSFDWDQPAEVLDGTFKIMFGTPNSYVTSVGNAALPLFYQELHEYNPDWVIERSYFPSDRSEYDKFVKAGLVPFTLEGKMPLTAYDVLCFSQSVAGQELHIIDVLLRSGIAPKWQDRKEEDPIIIRGGCNSFNPANIKDVCDLYYIGEGEDGIPKLLELIERGLRAGKSKEEILLEATNSWDGLWAPRFYEERFDEDGNLLGMFRLRDDVPEKIRKDYIRDLDNTFIYTKPITTFLDPSMSAGEVEITRGCHGKCSFCQEGFTYLPYRTRSVETSMAALKESQMYGGSADVLPSAFCSSTYPEIKTILKRTCEEVSDEISLISQRVDEFSGDPNFVALTSFVGNKTVSLGVEGNSQRMREAVSKNCKTEQIIEAIRLAYINGYQKIKLFMIANLPNETEEDVKEIVDLARQIREMLDANKIEGKAFPRITFSWTPLSIQPFTPYQWCRPPIGDRSLGDVLKPIKEYGFRVRIGGNSGSSAAEKIIQLTQRADSRLQDLFIEMAKAGVTYFGGIQGQSLDITERFFRKNNLPGWDYWFRECDKDNVFPWDFIDIGVKKDYLWWRHEVAMSDDPKSSPKCLDQCEQCGVCGKEDYERYKLYREQEANDHEVDISRIIPAYQTGNVQRLILKIETDEKHRFVGSDHWRFAVRRAFMLAGIPVSKKSINLASGAIPYRDWSYGVDYVSCNLVEKQSDAVEIVERLNEHACNFKVLEAKLYPFTGAVVRNSMDKVLYEMEIDQDLNTAKSRIKEVLESDEWIVPMTTEGFMGKQTEDKDVRPWIEDIWLANEDGKLMIRMLVSGELSPYVVYQNLFKLAWKKAGKYPARRLDIFLAVDATADDMFRPRCEECGDHIEVNIFDVPVDNFLCYRCQDVDSGCIVE